MKALLCCNEKVKDIVFAGEDTILYIQMRFLPDLALVDLDVSVLELSQIIKKAKDILRYHGIASLRSLTSRQTAGNALADGFSSQLVFMMEMMCCSMVSFGRAPTRLLTSFPSLNRSIVGMLRTS